eukprot:CAMPEP_0197423074 /NCGR_PEP_ID=MMETSP1170-20131217/19336_1 /TAXON_ID=54406 /ORGANISM="Sarcinochrysis sp, Strain CCMP770" /LENGTH=220 /DNA_ID=CAMNT_0042950465 /DNA_START=45 /DNA_END=708 /DNA_ORIENTATION=+
MVHDDDDLVDDEEGGRMSKSLTIGSAVFVLCVFFFARGISALHARQSRTIPSTVDCTGEPAESRDIALVPVSMADLPTARRLDSEGVCDEEFKEEPRRLLPTAAVVVAGRLDIELASDAFLQPLGRRRRPAEDCRVRREAGLVVRRRRRGTAATAWPWATLEVSHLVLPRRPPPLARAAFRGESAHASSPSLRRDKLTARSWHPAAGPRRHTTTQCLMMF